MAPIKPAKLPLLALAIGHFAVDIQTSGIAILIPLLRTQLHLDYGAAAAIVTAQTLTSSVIQPLFGLISDRRPVRQVLPLACLLAGTGTATVLFMPHYLWVLLVVIVTGFGSAAFHAAGSLNANYVSAGANKASGISMFFAAGQLGYSIGPLLLVGLMSAFGPTGILGTLVPAMLGAGVLSLTLSSFATGRGWQARQAGAGSAGLVATGSRRHVIWGLTIIVLVISLRSVLQTGLITFIPLYFAAIKPDSKDYAALLISVFVFTGALGTLFGGALADRLGRKRTMIISLGVVWPLLFVFLRASGALQVLALAFAGASLISASALTVVMAQELLPTNLGLASGLTLGLGFGAGGLGAAVLGVVGDSHGIATTMQVLGWLPIPLVLLCFLLPGRPAAVTTEGHLPLEAPLAVK